MILLSVHLITFNNQTYIEDTLQSILKQVVDFNYEVVVGDDYSTDKTLEIIKLYTKKHPNLFKVKKNNQRLGILKNFKSTLDRCKGKYVFDIAGDDILKSKYALQKMVNLFNINNNIGFVDCGYDSLYQSNKKVTPFKNKSQINAPNKTYIEEILLGKIAPTGICYNRLLLYKYVDFEAYISMNISIEDYPILVDLVMNSKFDRIDESLLIYRVHHNSYSNSKNFDEIIIQKNQMKHLFNFFVIKYNFSFDLINKYKNNHNKELLFLAGYFNKKNCGKIYFKNMKSKNIKDYIHYLASQSLLFRRFVSKAKKLFLN